MRPPATEALRLEGVAVRLGGRPVLRGVDLRLHRGEVLGLLGCNGAGKSTLLRTVTRVLEPEGGTVRVLGDPSTALSRRELARRVALVPQETRIPFPFRAGEVVLMGRGPHLAWAGFESDRDVAIARDALAQLGIGPLADRSVDALSGGERQLVVVARALAQQADLLLLDEPTAFLDLRHRLQVLEIVRAQAAAGRAALVVSHDLALAARYCDRLALLCEGRILAAGAPWEVLTPARLRQALGVEAEIVPGPAGEPLVVPRRPSAGAEC